MPFAAMSRLLLSTALLLFTLAAPCPAADRTPRSSEARAGEAAREALSALSRGRVQDLVVQFDASRIDEEAARLRLRAGLAFDDRRILDFKEEGFRRLKQALEPLLGTGEAELLRDYRRLPVVLARFRSPRALERLLEDQATVAVYRDAPLYPHLSRSLPFIGQPAVAQAGIGGEGVSVAVLDTGIDYTHPSFGSCTEPGVPQGCRVAASVDVTGNGLILNPDPGNHGSNVAGIVAGTAPGAGIVSINAFAQGISRVSWILAGIDWAISHQADYRIASLNMSFGDGAAYGSPCDLPGTNPFLGALSAARDAGILPVASSGNGGAAYGISSPACTPGVLSVGAVYDAQWGGPYAWGGSPPTCTDSLAAAPDRIPCFSNSASFLTMLAPGAFVTAAGIQKAGTSQAAPHVAAAAALLRSRFPGETLDQTEARLTGAGVPVTDPRNGVTTPRLNLLAALGPPENDAFASRTLLPGGSGSVSGGNLNATREPGEPLHAGGEGGSSVWWSWTPAESGVATLDAAGSGFAPLLSVYTGASVGTLTRVADGSGATPTAVFTALKGVQYQIALDGAQVGGIVLNRELAQRADLALSVDAPADAEQGGEIAVTATARNRGPSVAAGAAVTAVLPAGSRLLSASPCCTAAAGTVVCELGDLQPDASASVYIVVSPDTPGGLEFALSLFSSTADPALADNDAGVSCTVAAAPEPVPALSPVTAAACLAALSALLWRRGRGGR